MSLTPGATLGPYTITAELGRGGMGVVYTAQDPRLKRQVAIKLLTADLTRDETAKQRFLKAGRSAPRVEAKSIGRRCAVDLSQEEISEHIDSKIVDFHSSVLLHEGRLGQQRNDPLTCDPECRRDGEHLRVLFQE